MWKPCRAPQCQHWSQGPGLILFVMELSPTATGKLLQAMCALTMLLSDMLSNWAPAALNTKIALKLKLKDRSFPSSNFESCKLCHCCRLLVVLLLVVFAALTCWAQQVPWLMWLLPIVACLGNVGAAYLVIKRQSKKIVWRLSHVWSWITRVVGQMWSNVLLHGT